VAAPPRARIATSSRSPKSWS